jgi:hypothetical protein
VLAHATDAQPVRDMAEVEAVDITASFEQEAGDVLDVDGDWGKRPGNPLAAAAFDEKGDVLADTPAGDYGSPAYLGELREGDVEFDGILPAFRRVADDLEGAGDGVADVPWLDAGAPDGLLGEGARIPPRSMTSWS